MADLLLDVFVAGTPAPQGSKRYLGVGSKGNVRMAESSKKVEPWRADIRNAIENTITSYTDGCGLAVELCFYLPRPASHRGRRGQLTAAARQDPHGKPDLDKLARAVLDAVGSSGLVWADDAQVCSLWTSKAYDDEHRPGVRITVRRVQ